MTEKITLLMNLKFEASLIFKKWIRVQFQLCRGRLVNKVRVTHRKLRNEVKSSQQFFG